MSWSGAQLSFKVESEQLLRRRIATRPMPLVVFATTFYCLAEYQANIEHVFVLVSHVYQRALDLVDLPSLH